MTTKDIEIEGNEGQGLSKKAFRDRDNLRQHKRWPVLWSASIRLAGHDFSCQIWNLSLGGAQLKSDIPLRSGSDIILSIDGLPAIDGRLVWQEDDTFGFQFSITTDEAMDIFSRRLAVFKPEADTEDKDKTVESAA